MNDDGGARHLTTSALLQHWDSGVPVAIPIPGPPPLRLRIDAPRSRLTLRAPVAAGVLAPLNTLAHIAVDTLVEGGERYMEISTTDPRLVVDGYAMLMAVADRIQLDRMDPIAALRQTLATWGSILATRTRMSLQAEVGLFGELLLVQATIHSDAGGAAAWRGGLSEEHDFGFPELDVEVKTTTAERRHHWIHGIGQLVQTNGTPLWLISIQITRGGDQQGQTLSELAHDIREMTTGASRERVQQNLAASGWHEDDRDLYYERWRLRSTPLALLVGDDLPRLTPALLAKAGVATARLRQLTYEIDVTDQPPSPDPPSALAAIVAHMKHTTS